MASRWRLRSAVLGVIALVTACDSRPDRPPPAAILPKSNMSAFERVSLAEPPNFLAKSRDLEPVGPLVVPGTIDQGGAFPGVVAVGGGGRWECTGTLVGPRLVLTAKHCSWATAVALGASVEQGQARPYLVQEPAVVHSRADVALLRLVDAVPDARPHPLASRCPSVFSRPWEAELVGFGYRFATGAGGTGLRSSGKVTIAGLSCATAQAPAFSRLPCMNDLEFALRADPLAPDTCKGDSGGPVLVRGHGRRVIVGVTSRHIAEGGGCGQGGIYVRADAISDWARRYGAEVVECPL